MSEVVQHPETGKPAVAVVSYQELELESLTAQVDQLQGELDGVVAQQAEGALEQARLESELAEVKSLVDGYNQLVPATTVDEGATGTGSENEVGAETGDASGDNLDATASAGESTEPVVQF